MVQLDVHMTGRVLFFKTINVHENQLFWNFEQVPDNLTIRQAAERLEKTTVTASNVSSAKAN